jgi:hypothetical protein
MALARFSAPLPVPAVADDRVHALTGIKVHEVSVVDRPANRKKFLVTKNTKETPAEALARRGRAATAAIIKANGPVRGQAIVDAIVNRHRPAAPTTKAAPVCWDRDMAPKTRRR